MAVEPLILAAVTLFSFFFFFFEPQLTVRHKRENVCVVPPANNLAQKKRTVFVCLPVCSHKYNCHSAHVSECVCVRDGLRACELARAGMYTLSKSNPPESNELLELLK